MAIARRAAPLAWPAALLLALPPNALAASAEPVARPNAARVAPVARVDLGAPDPRCSDLAYPLWDDGMCVRAKCADDDTCDFSRVASAQTPAAPAGLSQERWRTASLRTAPTSTPAFKAAPTLLASIRVAPTLSAKAPPRPQDQRARDSLPLLAEARTLAAHAETPARAVRKVAPRGAGAARPSFWSRLRAAFDHLWRRVQTLSRDVLRSVQVRLASRAP